MMNLAVSGHFKRQLKKLSPANQKTVTASLKKFLNLLTEGNIPKGIGFKKINGNKYELRVDIRIRILMVFENNTFVYHIIGNHDNIRKYLRDYR
jgi:mRNA-degrading endonuclease RelE of RelBE toxin-antitoxin system